MTFILLNTIDILYFRNQTYRANVMVLDFKDETELNNFYIDIETDS